MGAWLSPGPGGQGGCLTDSCLVANSAVRERFPKLLRLVSEPHHAVGLKLPCWGPSSACHSLLPPLSPQDGHELPPPIAFDVEAPTTLPPCKVSRAPWGAALSSGVSGLGGSPWVGQGLLVHITSGRPAALSLSAALCTLCRGCIWGLRTGSWEWSPEDL